MNPLERRLHKVEGHALIATPAMTSVQIDARLDELFAKHGSTREQVVAEHGSPIKFARGLCQAIAFEPAC
jgi:hypothetical protein